MTNSLIRYVAIASLVLCVAPAKLRSDEPLSDLVDNVRSNEALYRNIEVVVHQASTLT